MSVVQHEDAQRAPWWPLAVAVGMLTIGYPSRRHSARTSFPQSREPDASSLVPRARRDTLDPERGRYARTLSEIPARGWKDILFRVYSNISEHRVIALAAGVTFYAILALFPAIAALVSIYALFADPGTISSHLDSLKGILPGGAIDVIREQLARLTSQKSTLGITFIGSLLISLWSANAGIKSVFDTLNIIYSEKEKRGFIKLNAISLAFTTAAIVFVLLAIGARAELASGLGARRRPTWSPAKPHTQRRPDVVRNSASLPSTVQRPQR